MTFCACPMHSKMYGHYFLDSGFSAGSENGFSAQKWAPKPLPRATPRVRPRVVQKVGQRVFQNVAQRSVSSKRYQQINQKNDQSKYHNIGRPRERASIRLYVTTSSDDDGGQRQAQRTRGTFLTQIFKGGCGCKIFEICNLISDNCQNRLKYKNSTK